MRRGPAAVFWFSLAAAVFGGGDVKRVSAGVDQAEPGGPGQGLRLYCQEQPGFWARTKGAANLRYCAAITRAQAALWSNSERAEQELASARALRADGAQIALLSAQLDLVQGEPARSHEQWLAVEAQLGSREVAAIRGPEWAAAARAALLSGAYEHALSRYRRAVLRLADWGSARQRARVLLEASTAASYVGPHRYDEAAAYLSRARGEFAPLLQPVSRAMQQLLAQRRSLSALRSSTGLRSAAVSSTPEAAAQLQYQLEWIFERSEPSSGSPEQLLPVLPAGEREALVAGLDRRALLWDQALDSLGEAPLHILDHAREMTR